MRHLAIAALLGPGLTGCSDFLSGPTIDEDPNNPTVIQASEDNLFAGFQAVQFTQHTSTLSVTICGYVQQCKGVAARFVEDQLTEYSSDPLTFDAQFIQVYSIGGLRDLREAQAKLTARTIPDPLYEGITKVWEALIISEAADKWGDIPYSEASQDDISVPALDDQLAIYANLLTLLDQAIAQIQDPTGVGPGGVDFVYGGDVASWVAMAHTLKARILLHTVRAQCPTLAGCAVYNQIIPEALAGIQLGGADFTTVTSGASALESNGWFQFYELSGFGGDLRAGDFIVNLMATRNAGGPDPRSATYFGATTECALPADALGLVIRRACLASGASFAQPWVTAEENALILAEAYFNTGQAPLALAQVNAVRTANGLAALGAVTLPAIMEEKYVSLFQNPEVWNDYKRTCLPAITPTSDQGPISTLIPRRVFYGQTESDVNTNIPDASTQVGAGTPNQPTFRNDNDVPGADCSPISL
jgi:hypothetical protein